MISIMAEVENADNTEKKKPLSSANCSEFLRPHVSVRKPQKCELTTMPKNPIESKTPCCISVNSISHFADGTTNPMFISSVTNESKLPPATNNSIR